MTDFWNAPIPIIIWLGIVYVLVSLLYKHQQKVGDRQFKELKFRKEQGIPVQYTIESFGLTENFNQLSTDAELFIHDLFIYIRPIPISQGNLTYHRLPDIFTNDIKAVMQLTSIHNIVRPDHISLIYRHTLRLEYSIPSLGTIRNEVFVELKDDRRMNEFEMLRKWVTNKTDQT